MFIRLSLTDSTGEQRTSIINENHIVFLSYVESPDRRPYWRITMNTGHTFETYYDFSSWGN